MKTTRLLAGASGYSFKEWQGDFYPPKIRPDQMLAFYGSHLPTVEINYTFRRLPTAELLAKWSGMVPEHFRFAIKATQSITHVAKLHPDKAAEPLRALYEAMPALAIHRGPVLFQLPPYVRCDAQLLRDFLALLPADHGAAFEFRHESWFVDRVYDTLRSAGAALCLSEREDNEPPPLVETADFGYVRLRLEQYAEKALAAWSKKLASTSWKTVYAYFMHEPTAPAYAAALMRHAA